MKLPKIDFTSNQAVFDHIVGHLLNQGKRCVAEVTRGMPWCQYREGNLACAIGCLMTDEEAAKADRAASGEAWGILEVLDNIPSVEERLRYANHEMLAMMQDIHDSAGDFHDPAPFWKERFQQVAECMGLEWRYGETGGADAVT